jgi:indolepyruvate ferredoxin oxidoreductase
MNLTRAVREMRPLGSPLFRLLAKCKRLRGTAFGVFGYTAERKLKRRVIADY